VGILESLALTNGVRGYYGIFQQVMYRGQEKEVYGQLQKESPRVNVGKKVRFG
jgi:hypothetical protein